MTVNTGSQFIEIQKVSEENDTLLQVDFSFLPFVRYAYQADNAKEKYPWITSVDEYGNTYINYIQRDYFVDELNALKHDIDDAETLTNLEKMVEIFNQQANHQYIKLLGD